jgi:hypothetical protein
VEPIYLYPLFNFCYCFYSGFAQVGGINGLIPKYMDAIPDSLRYPVNITTNDTLSNVTSHCGYPRADSFHIIRDAVHSDLPWPGLLIRSTFVSTWYWCADQVLNVVRIVELLVFMI